MASDLERKFETALAERLRQHPDLKKLRIRHSSEDSAKVNQDFVLAAKRGVQNPPFSGVFELEITATLSVRYRKTVDTLPSFLATLKAVEEVLTANGNETVIFGVPIGILASQLSLCAADFHCYEVALSGKDDTPQDQKHNCIWTLSAIAMSQNYEIVSQIQQANSINVMTTDTGVVMATEDGALMTTEKEP